MRWRGLTLKKFLTVETAVNGGEVIMGTFIDRERESERRQGKAKVILLLLLFLFLIFSFKIEIEKGRVLLLFIN